MNKEIKAGFICLVAFLLGCAIAITGCSVTVEVQSPIGKAGTSLEVEYCSCCGFAPWSDSWCEEHYGT